MTATLAASTAILKTRYPDGRLPKAIYERTKFIATVQKKEDFTGNNYQMALQNECPQGSSSDFATALGSLAQGTYNDFLVTRVEHFGIARIKGQALKAAEGNEGALVDLWKNECDGISRTETNNHEIYSFGDGSGTLGQISSGSSVSTATITLTTISDITKFALGMRLQAVSDATLSPTLRTGYAVVTGLDRGAGTITLAGNWNAAITGVATSDYLVRAGDFAASSTAKVMTGMFLWIGVSTTIFGLTRTTDPVRFGGQSYTATGVPFEEAVIEMSALVNQQGAKQPDTLWMNPRDLATFKKALGAKVAYPRVNMDATMAGVSFEGIEIDGDEGKIKVMTSPFMGRNKAALVNMADWRLHSLGPAPHLQNYDKAEFLRVSGDDAVEARFASYVQLECPNPFGQIVTTTLGS